MPAKRNRVSIAVDHTSSGGGEGMLGTAKAVFCIVDRRLLIIEVRFDDFPVPSSVVVVVVFVLQNDQDEDSKRTNGRYKGQEIIEYTLWNRCL